MSERVAVAGLPRIIMFGELRDSGEFGADNCAHCGAKGRYQRSFVCEDGTHRSAMAGCIQLFPVSKLAKEHLAILKRSEERAQSGGKLAGWDVAKLEAINAAAIGEMTVDEALAVVARENAKRSEWMRRKGIRQYR